MPELSRRDLLSAAAGGVTGLAAVSAGDEPRGPASKDPLAVTTLPSFRLALEEQPGKVMPGGSAREATAAELPVSQGLSGVSMRLKPGGLRELHWHANAAEWAFVVRGRVRTTVIAPDGTAEINDFGPGDVWYFPRGHGHSIQGLGPDECHFILVFDNGAFSEFGTFSSTDWLAQTPPSVLSKSLGLPAFEFQQFPPGEVYVAVGRVPPGPIPALRSESLRPPALTHFYSLLSRAPYEVFPGGREWRVTAREFPISQTISGIVLELDPGAVREPHWHPNANEWQYYLQGEARMGVFGARGRSRTERFGEGDVGYVPRGYGHYIENTGAKPCRILIAFDSGEYQEISLSTWLAANPVRLLADNFQVADAIAERLPDHRVFIAPAASE
ncbi:MAG: cupin domain-containing protein [Planctomycetaceae bacterium]